MSKTGLQDNCMVLDWLSFTLDGYDGLQIVSDIFGTKRDRKHGTRGYSHSAEILDKGTVSWTPDQPEQGVHIELSSTALSSLIEIDKTYSDMHGFLLLIIDLGAQITRADFAVDDRNEELSLDVIRQSVFDEAYTCRSRVIDLHKRIKGGSSETIYFGTRKSESFLRIYNKQAEQIDRGYDDPGQWIRVELELKGKRSHRATQKYLSDGITAIIGLVRNQVDFKKSCSDPNRTRWPSCEWWSGFLGQAEKTTLGAPRELPTIERTKKWLYSQVAPSLAFADAAEGGSIELYNSLIENGIHRLRPIHRALLSSKKDTE